MRFFSFIVKRIYFIWFILIFVVTGDAHLHFVIYFLKLFFIGRPT